ncbi:hypothetical protein SAMN05443245_6208 [Paraburkholderia fungorum]|uniref:Uncharacterized protein n=2 Tax=Paraburkholderia fungorum TaxID=134537 RepID=A0A1H1JEU8_9BURK|nr:hypothetical protein SAMN05443245_6208 [Paraburkholderia fungorum]
MLVAGVLSIAGCATTYQEPTQSDASTLVFRKAADFTAQAMIYGGAAECTERHLLPVMNTDKELARKVIPGAPLSFSMFYTKNLLVAGRFCVDTLTFTPAADHTYVATLSVNDGQCHIDLKDRGAAAAPLATPEPVISKEHNWKRAMTEQGPFCGS